MTLALFSETPRIADGDSELEEGEIVSLSPPLATSVPTQHQKQKQKPATVSVHRDSLLYERLRAAKNKTFVDVINDIDPTPPTSIPPPLPDSAIPSAPSSVFSTPIALSSVAANPYGLPHAPPPPLVVPHQFQYDDPSGVGPGPSFWQPQSHGQPFNPYQPPAPAFAFGAPPMVPVFPFVQQQHHPFMGPPPHMHRSVPYDSFLGPPLLLRKPEAPAKKTKKKKKKSKKVKAEPSHAVVEMDEDVVMEEADSEDELPMEAEEVPDAVPDEPVLDIATLRRGLGQRPNRQRASIRTFQFNLVQPTPLTRNLSQPKRVRSHSDTPLLSYPTSPPGRSAPKCSFKHSAWTRRSYTPHSTNSPDEPHTTSAS